MFFCQLRTAFLQETMVAWFLCQFFYLVWQLMTMQGKYKLAIIQIIEDFALRKIILVL